MSILTLPLDGERFIWKALSMFEKFPVEGERTIW